MLSSCHVLHNTLLYVTLMHRSIIGVWAMSQMPMAAQKILAIGHRNTKIRMCSHERD